MGWGLAIGAAISAGSAYMSSQSQKDAADQQAALAAGADSSIFGSIPDQTDWQPVEYNALHGGMQRWFAPIAPETLGNPAWARLVQAVVREAAAIRAPQDAWFVEAHQFRIDAADGIGRPTPEGAHRDGVDLVAVFLLARHQIRGGETRVFDAHGPTGLRFTLSEPWSLLLLDDARVIHESTPIQPDAADAAACWRDTLVLTCRSGGFLGG